MTGSNPVVLVVDDEEELADLYATWLPDAYDVRTAYSGADALQMLGDDVSAVLLDRHMPTTSGDEVLEKIRSRDLDCRVAMVTAVDPGFDIVEMGFDTYVVKPCSRREITTVVDRLLALGSYDETLHRYFSLASKVAVLEAEKSEAELERNDDYQSLRAKLDSCRADAEGVANEFDELEFRALFHDFTPPTSDDPRAASTPRPSRDTPNSDTYSE
jgi:DNA-binding response OmpR family regulator